MKVLQVSNDLGESSGVATFVRRVNAELVKLGVDSSIVSAASELPSGGARMPDIVHIHGLWCGLHHAAAKWARGANVSLVWSTHGMTAPWAMRHKRWKKLPAWWLYQRGDLRRATALHSTTELEAEWNRRLGLPPSFVVPLGTDLPEGTSAGDAPVSGEASRLNVLFVGRIYPVKGLVNLVQAAERLRRSSSARFAFRLVGPDQAGHRAELEKLCRQAGLDNVEFPGARHGADLAREYAACDVLVLPSFTENFGGVVVDALAHGKPVIASRFTPWKVLADSRCGWWVDNAPPSLAEALDTVARMAPRERSAWGARGRALVEASYTWPAVGRALLEQYARLAMPRAKGGR